MVGATLLALALTSGSTAVWPRGEGGQVWVQNAGLFSNRGGDARNLINAPVAAFASDPAALDIAPEVVAALNSGFAEQTDGAIRDMHLKPFRARPDLARMTKAATPLIGPTDRYFTLRVEASPESGQGGHTAGNHLRVTVASLHRAADIVGVGETDVLAGSAEVAPMLLRSAMVVALTEAFTDLRAHLDDEKVRVRAFVTLVVDANGLTPEQRAYAYGPLATCAAQLAEPLEVTVAGSDTAQASRIEYRLRRHEETETEDIFITNYAGRLSFEMGSAGKDKCSTGKTPLEAFDVRVIRDIRAKQVTVRFVPKPELPKPEQEAE